MTKVAIIEDELMIRMNLEAYLEDEGYTVLTAGLGNEGVELIKNNSDLDVAIVDIRLPDIEGTQVILNAHSHVPSLKYIIYTGSTEYVLPDELKNIGMTEENLIFKPIVEMHKLTSLIESLISSCE